MVIVWLASHRGESWELWSQLSVGEPARRDEQPMPTRPPDMLESVTNLATHHQSLLSPGIFYMCVRCPSRRGTLRPCNTSPRPVRQ